MLNVVGFKNRVQTIYIKYVISNEYLQAAGTQEHICLCILIWDTVSYSSPEIIKVFQYFLILETKRNFNIW